MRRVWIVLGQAAFHFLQFSHQIGFRVQSSSGIAKQEFDLSFLGCLIGLVTKRGWIGVVLTANHFHPQSLGPDAKLLDRRRAKGVRSREQDTMSIFLEIMRELGG